MHRISFTRILLYFGWLPLLLAGVAVAIQALRITGKPTEFFAVGKVLVGRNSRGVCAVLLGTDDHLHHKYEDIAAIISGAPLHGAKTIDVTVPQSPTVSPS